MKRIHGSNRKKIRSESTESNLKILLPIESCTIYEKHKLYILLQKMKIRSTEPILKLKEKELEK